MVEYFIRLENCTYLPRGTPGHGFDGFIQSSHNITYLTDRLGVAKMLSSAAWEVEGIHPNSTSELGALLQRDVNSPTKKYTPGIYQLAAHVTAEKRRSSVRNYLVNTLKATKADGRQKYPLFLSTLSLATRVLLDQSSDRPRAYGVQCQVGEGLYGADRRYNGSQTGELKTVTASKEVIISGGTFSTPQLLRLSGIGLRAELESLDIRVVVDLPAVGKHLQDHYETTVVIDASVPWEDNQSDRCAFKFGPTDPCFVEWSESHTGPYGEGAAPYSLIYNSGIGNNGDPDLWLYGSTNAALRGFYPAGFYDLTPTPKSILWALLKMPALGNASLGSVTLNSTKYPIHLFRR